MVSAWWKSEATAKMSRKKLSLTKAGQPRKRAPGAGAPIKGNIRVVGYVKPATYDKIDAMQLEQGCTVGVALDLLLASAK